MDRKQLETALNLLESGKTAAPKDGSEGGFLLLTSTGREEIYIDSQERELLTLCQNNNAVQPGLIQWLAFMNPEKIVSAEFQDDFNPDLNFYTEEHDILGKISDILKSLQVTGVRRTDFVVDEEEGFNPPTGRMKAVFINLSFSTGVLYTVVFDESSLEISSSDMRYFLEYSFAEGQKEQVIDALSSVI